MNINKLARALKVIFVVLGVLVVAAIAILVGYGAVAMVAQAIHQGMN